MLPKVPISYFASPNSGSRENKVERTHSRTPQKLRPTSFVSIYALCAAIASALPTETDDHHLEARVQQPQVYGRTCYCGDDCNTVSWVYAWEWYDGGCFNFYTGMSAAWIDASSTCTFYNAANCQASAMASSSTYANSIVG